MSLRTGIDTGSVSTNAVGAADQQATRAAVADRIRWGPVWAGLVVALATFLLIQLALFAIGALTLGLDPANDSVTAPWLSGLAALVAFFVGGLTAGATAVWRRADDGLLQGVVLWALGLLGLLFLAAQGLGFLGSLGDTVARLDFIQNANLNPAEAVEGFDAASAVRTAREAAAGAVLGLGLTLAASALGGTVGAKMAQARMGQAEVADLR